MFIRKSLALILALGLTTSAWAGTPIDILVEGDSQSTGYLLTGTDVPWPDLVANDLSKTLINLSVNGQTTTSVLNRVDADLVTYDPDIILIMISVNDFPAIAKNDVQALALFKWRIRDIIRKAYTAEPNATIVVGTLIHNKTTGDWPEVYDFQGDLPLITHQLADELNADIRYAKVADTLLDVYYNQGASAWAALWIDPYQPVVHPSASGHQKIADAFVDALN